MNWKEINRQSGIYPMNEKMDIYFTSLGFTTNSLQNLLNPCEMHNANLLKDYQKTIQAIEEYINQDKKICIVSDYDADGITSNAVLYLALDFCGACVDYIVPHRIKDGYGLNNSHVDRAIDMGAEVILTCDNGITAHEAIQYARDKGLDVIVTDHHTPNNELPNANYIVHPCLGDYPFPYISGCQTAYKVAIGILDKVSPVSTHKIAKKSLKKKEEELRKYLFQLATISIVTDVMPIASSEDDLSAVNENRKWLIDGMKMIRDEPNWHIKLMMDMLKINPETFDEQSIGFYLGPCLNAVGRLDDASEAVKFLISQTEKEAQKQLSFMIFINEERKEIKKEAIKNIQLDDSLSTNIIIHEDIHEGIIGVLAGLYTGDTNKPTIVMTNCMINNKKAWKGSARGTGEVSLYEILNSISTKSNCLYAFGGHKDAAGLTVLDENIDEFKEMFLKAMEDKLNQSTYEKNYINIASRKERLDFIKAIESLKPFGNGLPLPIIEISCNLSEINLYNKSKHVKFTQYEMEYQKGKKTFPTLEFWIWNEADKIRALCDDRFTKTTNIDMLMQKNGISQDEATAICVETYKRKKDKKIPIKYKLEVSYTDFGGLGPNYSVVEIDML